MCVHVAARTMRCMPAGRRLQVRPEHVMVSSREVWLLDFSMATSRHAPGLASRAAALEYSAPEVLMQPSMGKVVQQVSGAGATWWKRGFGG